MLPIILPTKPFALCFVITPSPDNDGCQFRYELGGHPVLTATWTEGELTIAMEYEEHDKPLTLRCAANEGDKMRFVYQPHRAELWKNGVIQDEEWPFGTALLYEGTLVHSEGPLTREDVPEPEPLPDVTGSFENAEGWMPGNGVFVGDCMPFAHGDRYHVLYLKDRHHHRSKWGKGAHQWEHLSTADLMHWDMHPMAVAIDDPSEGSVCTGSWILEKGVHQLYYTIRMSDGTAAPIQRSLSADGFHFRKDAGFRFTLSDAYHKESARDPKVVRGEDGLLHMFVTTTQLSSGKGCLAHLTSADGDTWTEVEPIYISPDGDQPECPDYIAYRGRYYLIFSHHGTAQYLLSDKPFSDWRKPENDKIPCEAVPKAAVWRDRIIFTGFKRIEGYAGTMTFMEAGVDEKGEFVFSAVREMQKSVNISEEDIQ